MKVWGVCVQTLGRFSRRGLRSSLRPMTLPVRRRLKPAPTAFAAGLLFSSVLLATTVAFADSSALILRGVAGDPEHEQKFEKWTTGTAKALVDKFGFSADRVIVLTDKKTAQAEI